MLYANIDENDLLSLPIEEQNKRIIEIFNEVMPLHDSNRIESQYLKDYKNGLQDIYNDKQKLTRKEIDNKTVENWAYAFIDFKKCFLLGKPIQYTMANDKSANEIAILNKYCKYEGKKTKDMDIYDDILTCGRGFRYNYFDKPQDEDEAPFEMINLDTEYTEVVYSSGIRKEQLFAFIETPMKYINNEVDLKTGTIKQLTQFYSEYTVYLRNRKFTISNRFGGYTIKEGSEVPILINKHIITEYYTNKSRISLIEIGKDLFNDINYLESLDKDDMEQFVNALMVFTNAQIDAEELSEIRDLGAVSISSTDNREAKVELLEQRLKASDTQVYYTRLLTSLHQILGIPMSTDNGSVTSGDTGKAKLTGQGYTMAGIRIEGDQTMFDTCDKKSLDVILTICKESANSQIKELKISDIEANFSRDTSDNLLVKTQGLMNLYSCDIPREIANSVVNLFNDPNAVTKMQEKLFGQQVSQQGKGTNTEKNTTNKEDIANEQNNSLTQVNQIDDQQK